MMKSMKRDQALLQSPDPEIKSINDYYLARAFRND